MINTNLFTSFNNKFLKAFFYTLVLFIFAAFSAHQSAVFGQPKLGDTVYKKNSEDTNKQKNSKKKPKTTVAKNNAATNKNQPPVTKKTVPKNFLDVTFFSREPAVEI